MPKTYLRQIDRFVGMIKANYMAVKGGKSFAELGRICGTCASTAYNRAKDPLELTLGEVYMLCKHEKIPITDFVGEELKLRGGDKERTEARKNA